MEIILAYFPPYSPDLNPIEERFMEIKAWSRKYSKLAKTMEFMEFLDHALTSVKGGARRHFACSQISMSICKDSEEDYWDD